MVRYVTNLFDDCANPVSPRTLSVGERITVQLVYRLTRLDLTKKKIACFLVGSEAAESKLVKL